MAKQAKHSAGSGCNGAEAVRKAAEQQRSLLEDLKQRVAAAVAEDSEKLETIDDRYLRKSVESYGK